MGVFNWSKGTSLNEEEIGDKLGDKDVLEVDREDADKVGEGVDLGKSFNSA